MALTQISTAGVKDDAVTAGKIPANAVGSSELADNAVDTAAIADDAVTAAKLASNAVVNASVDASAAIAGSKIAPDFGSQNVVTTGTLGSAAITSTGGITISNSAPRLTFTDTNENPDFYIQGNATEFLIQDATNDAQRFRIQSNGVVDIAGNTNFSAGIDVVGTATATQFTYASHPGHTAFTGNNSTTTITILSGHNVNSVLVVYNGLVLTPTTDYTISGTTMTMQFTPPTNAQIIVRYLPN